ncbi:hypothetical protein [Tenacibaculum singaporense]|nr:hypothetical protein [Tenacibaculum singaporense]
MKLRITQLVKVLFAFMISVSVFAQKAKVERIYVSCWQFPKTTISPKKSTFSIAPINSDSRIEVLIGEPYKVEPPRKVENYKNTLLKDFLERIRLRQFKHVNKGGDLVFNVVKSDIQVKTIVEKKKNQLQPESSTFVAKINSDIEIEIEILDKEKRKITTIEISKSISILDKEKESKLEAEKLVVSEFKKNEDDHLSTAVSYYYGAIIDALEKIIKEIDYTVDEEGVNIFRIAKGEKYGADDVNELVENLKKINNDNLDPDDLTFKAEVKNIANKFEELLPRFSEKDKKEKRIKWAIYSNLSACNFMLSDYKKALEYITKREEIRYKRSYVYNKRLLKRRISLLNNYEAQAEKRDKTTHNYYMGLKPSDNDRFWGHQSNTYVRYFIDAYFVKKSSVEGVVINPETYFNVLFKKVKYLKRKKGRFYQNDNLKNMISYANRMDSEMFFNKYPTKHINEKLTDFDFKTICDFYTTTDAEKKLFKDLIEKAADILKQFSIEGYKGDGELNKRLLSKLYRYARLKRLSRELKDYSDIIYYETSKEIKNGGINFDEYTIDETIDYINDILSFAEGVVF